jgi:carbon starvation protein
VLPLWVLLQPRGYLGGYFLYVTLAAGFVGLLVGQEPVRYPAFVGFENPQGLPLFPILFVTIACGACSGFHGLVASGTTSKQVERETHARLVGYGGMLLEGVIAVMALATVMVLPYGDPALKGDATLTFAQGLARFFGVLGVSPSFGVAFGMLAFATFVYDTLDVATRLGRYIVQEFTGWTGAAGRFAATLATLALPALYLVLMPQALDARGNPIPAWKVIWPVFGTSNQLLAGLTLLAITLWLYRGGRRTRFVAIPMVFMFVMTCWSLVLTSRQFVGPLVAGAVRLDAQGLNGLIATGLLGLALWLAAEALLAARAPRRPAGT